MCFGPHPEAHVRRRRRRLASAVVRRFYFCGGDRCWGSHAPAYCLIGQLLCDPQRDAEEVIDEFCQGLFEESAAPMKNFFHAYYEKTGHSWELMLPEILGQPYDYVSHEKPEELYLTSFPQGGSRAMREPLDAPPKRWLQTTASSAPWECRLVRLRAAPGEALGIRDGGLGMGGQRRVDA